MPTWEKGVPCSLPSHEGSGLKLKRGENGELTVERLPSHEGSGLKLHSIVCNRPSISLPSHEGSGLKLKI